MQIYVKLMHCAFRLCETEKRYCRSWVYMKHHPNEKLKNTCIMVFSALADFIDCCKGYYPRRRELWELATKHHSSVQQERRIIENQEINHKNQENNENNHERPKETKDSENHNKPASEPRNHNKQNNGCFSVLLKRVLVCPCFLVWVLFLFLIFCITSLWLHLSATPRNYHDNHNKEPKKQTCKNKIKFNFEDWLDWITSWSLLLHVFQKANLLLKHNNINGEINTKTVGSSENDSHN